MIATVVVPVDLCTPSEVVLGVASTVARRMGATLHIVTVSSPGLDHMEDEVELAALAKSVDGPEVHSRVIPSNDVAAALIDAAGPDSLLCLGTRAEGPITALVMGSVASAVLRSTTRPVLLVGPATRAGLRFDRIEACIDEPDATAALLSVLGTWSHHLDLEMRLVHVWVPGQPHFPSREAVWEELDRAATVLADRYGVKATCAVLDGPQAAMSIVSDAEANRISVVGVAMRHRSGLRPRVLGSVAVAVAHATSAAVLAVPIGTDQHSA